MDLVGLNFFLFLFFLGCAGQAEWLKTESSLFLNGACQNMYRCNDACMHACVHKYCNFELLLGQATIYTHGSRCQLSLVIVLIVVIYIYIYLYIYFFRYRYRYRYRYGDIDMYIYAHTYIHTYIYISLSFYICVNQILFGMGRLYH